MSKMICNSWYWLWTSTGEKFKKCSMNYNCPKDCACGMLQVDDTLPQNQAQNTNKGTLCAAAEGYALETRGKEEAGCRSRSSPDWIGRVQFPY